MAILPHIASLSALGKALLTQDCLLCGAASDEAILCAACFRELPRLPLTCCPRCALPTTQGEICGRCLANPPHYDSTRAAFRYDFPLDRLIQSFKYGHRLALCAFFAEQLAALAQGLEVDRIIPLPLHPSRLRERGFNQALELARPLARALDLPLRAGLLQRSKATRAQSRLDADARSRNLHGAFRVDAGTTLPMHVALVDDVMTTGATLHAAAEILRTAGVARIDAWVCARVA